MPREIKLKISMDGGKVVDAQIDEIGDGLHDLAVRDARAAKQALDSIDRTSLNNIQSQIQKVNANLKSFGVELQRLGSQIQNFGGQIQGFGQQLTVGVTLPIIGLGTLAIKTFADVESAVAEISTIKPQINTTEVIKALEEMSERVPQTAQELGAGLYNIFSSIEVSQAGALKLLETFAKGATAAKTDTQTFGTAVLGVMNAYKLSVDDAAHITDVFFNTVNLGVVNGQELAGSLGVVTQAAKNAGVSFNELGALIVGVTKEGGDASQNINNLANFLQKLPTKEAADAFKKLGVEVQIGGKFRPVLDVLGDLQTKLKSMSESDAAQALQNIFPDAQARTGVQTLLSQLDTVKQALELNQKTAGAADQAYQKIAGTANVQFTLLKNTGIAILSELGGAILPLLMPLVIWLTSNLVPAVKLAVETFQNWSPEMQQITLAIVGVAAALGPVLVVVGTVVAGFGALVAAIGTIAASAGTIGIVAVAIVGLGLQISVVSGYAAILYAAWQNNFGGIRELTATVAQAVQNKWSQMLEAIKKLTADVTSQVSKFWVENGEDIKKAVGVVSEYVKKTWQSVAAFWSANSDTIQSITSKVWSVVKTVILGATSVISNAIKLVAAVINGDWAKVWQAAKAILVSAVKAWGSLITNGGLAVVNAVKLLFKGIWSLNNWVMAEAATLGKNLILGIGNGMISLGSTLWEKGKSLVSGLLNSMRSEAQVQSPSKKAIEIGQFISEGLAIGLSNRMSQIKAAAKKAASEAIEEFQKLAGASADVVQTMQMTERVKNAASGQQEIIKLRDELKLNNGLSLPSTVSDTESELSFLRQKKSEYEKFNKTIDDLRDGYKELQDAAEAAQKTFDEKLKGITDSSEIELLNLQEEIQLTYQRNEIDRQKIKNTYDIKRLREEMSADGFGEQQIEEAKKVLKSEQARRFELQRILEIRKQVNEAEDLGKGLENQLFDAQHGNREITEYEKTLRKINTDLKDISPAQKEYLLNLAKQIDAQKQFNESWNKTYDFIRGALDVAFEKGKSFGDKMKSIFGGVFNSFKKMVLDMVATWATNAIFGGGGSKSGGGFGAIFQNILGGIFGGRGVSGNQTGFPNVMNFTGSGQLPRGSAGNLLQFLTQQPNLPREAGKPDIWKTIFGSKGFGFNSGTIGGLASIGTLAGGLIGGRAGSFISNISSGALMGLQFGGPIGAAVGAVGGLIMSFFGSGKQQKADEKARSQFLIGGFDSLKQFDTLIADVRSLRTDPASAISQGESLGSQVRAQYLQQANALKDKKTRNIALRDVSRIDDIIRQKMDELRRVAEIAQGSADRDKLILPEFAKGNFFGIDNQMRDMQLALQSKRPNGFIAGGQLGVDRHLGLFADGETIINSKQRNRIINIVGFDPLEFAGIPNYPRKGSLRKYADGNHFNNSGTFTGTLPGANLSAGQNTVVIENLNLSIKANVDAEDIFITGIETEAGQRVLVKNINLKKKSGDI